MPCYNLSLYVNNPSIPAVEPHGLGGMAAPDQTAELPTSDAGGTGSPAFAEPSIIDLVLCELVGAGVRRSGAGLPHPVNLGLPLLGCHEPWSAVASSAGSGRLPRLPRSAPLLLLPCCRAAGDHRNISTLFALFEVAAARKQEPHAGHVMQQHASALFQEIRLHSQV